MMSAKSCADSPSSRPSGIADLPVLDNSSISERKITRGLPSACRIVMLALDSAAITPVTTWRDDDVVQVAIVERTVGIENRQQQIIGCFCSEWREIGADGAARLVKAMADGALLVEERLAACRITGKFHC
jgi:hypothetical protein